MTVDNHCSKSFNIIRLNKDNIYKYIPEMKKYEDKIKREIEEISKKEKEEKEK